MFEQLQQFQMFWRVAEFFCVFNYVERLEPLELLEPDRAGLTGGL